MAALTLTEAVIEAFAAIDAVPGEEQILDAAVGKYAAGYGSYYWTVRTQREYGNQPTDRTFTSFDRRSAKTQVLAAFAKLDSDIPKDVEPESPDDAEEGG